MDECLRDVIIMYVLSRFTEGMDVYLGRQIKTVNEDPLTLVIFRIIPAADADLSLTVSRVIKPTVQYNYS